MTYRVWHGKNDVEATGRDIEAATPEEAVRAYAEADSDDSGIKDWMYKRSKQVIYARGQDGVVHGFKVLKISLGAIFTVDPS